jgi:hypothetical protein
MRLTSLEAVKRFIGITDTTNDVLLGELLDGVSASIETDLRRHIALGTYSDKFDIDYDYTEDLQLGEYPIQSIVALTDNGVLLTENTHYYWTEAGYIRRLSKGTTLSVSGYFFTVGAQIVEVTWVAGYEPIPDDIQLIAKKLVSQIYNTGDAGPYQSEKIGDYSYKVLQDMKIGDPFLESTLNRYRKVW